jgi:hypothetical protein
VHTVCKKGVRILELSVNKGQCFSFRGKQSVLQQATVVGWSQFIGKKNTFSFHYAAD